MKKVRVCIDLDDAMYRSLADEASREQVSVESLVQQMVQGLISELRQEEEDGTDQLIIPS